MKAVITGTPVQIEGEPAEIAQLVELLSSGAVMVEHVHTWKLGTPDENGVCHGKCWCGTERNFAPFEGQPSFGRSTAHLGLGGTYDETKDRESIERRKKGTRGGPNNCSVWGGLGHNKSKCPQR